MTRSPGEVPERAYGIPMTTISDKMAARGVGALTDRELLTLLTEDGQRADALLAACGDSLARIAGEGEARLRMIGGLGLRRARLLLAAAEFGKPTKTRMGGGKREIDKLPRTRYNDRYHISD